MSRAADSGKDRVFDKEFFGVGPVTVVIDWGVNDPALMSGRDVDCVASEIYHRVIGDVRAFADLLKSGVCVSGENLAYRALYVRANGIFLDRLGSLVEPGIFDEGKVVIKVNGWPDARYEDALLQQ